MLRRIEWPMFTTWLSRLPEEVRKEVNADLRYLCEFGRGAALPTVRHRIQASAEYPNMARDPDRGDGGAAALGDPLPCRSRRPRPGYACCVGGDKAQWERAHPDGPDWYEAFVPVADQIFRRLHSEEGWKR